MGGGSRVSRLAETVPHRSYMPLGKGVCRYFLEDVDYYGRTTPHPGVEVVVPKPGVRRKPGRLKR